MATKYDPKVAVTLRLSDIDADYKWNARTRIQDVAQESDDKRTDAGYLDILLSIATDKHGQKQPVVVRPHPKAGQKISGRTYPPFFLCSGFQRYKAIAEIASGAQSDHLAKVGKMLPSAIKALETDKPTIQAFVRDLNDFEARKENLSENTERSSLAAPDIAFGMADLFKQDKTLTIEQAGAFLGISPAYASALRATYEGLKSVTVPADHKLNPTHKSDRAKDMTLAEVWRQSATPIKKNDALSVANLKGSDGKTEASSDEKLEAYAKVIGQGKPDTNRGPGSWVGNAIQKHAVTMGTLLGNLQRDGGIELIDITAEHVPLLLAPLQKIPTLADHEKVRAANPKSHMPDYETALDQIAVAIKKAYHKGLAAAPVVETPKADKKDATEKAATTDGIPSPAEEGSAGKRGKKGAANGRATA